MKIRNYTFSYFFNVSGYSICKRTRGPVRKDSLKIASDKPLQSDLATAEGVTITIPTIRQIIGKRIPI